MSGGAILLSLCAWLLSAYSIRLPLLLHLLPFATSFWLSGYLIARLLYSRCTNLKYVMFVAFCPLICYLSCDIGDMHFNVINSYPAFYVMPISCAYLVICIVSIMLYFLDIPLSNKYLYMFLGKKSLI